MKKLFSSLLVAVGITGLSAVFACGGMTQIDPPSLQLDAGPADTTVDSVVDELQGIVVIC